MHIYQAEVLRAICICEHFADPFSLSQLLLRFTSSTKYQSFAFLFYNELRRSHYDSPSFCKQKQKTKRPGENNIPLHTKTTHLHQRFFERSTTKIKKKTKRIFIIPICLVLLDGGKRLFHNPTIPSFSTVNGNNTCRRAARLNS